MRATNIVGFMACPAPCVVYGGGRGIRTPETRKGLTVFKTVPFNHSGIPPCPDCRSVCMRTVFPRHPRMRRGARTRSPDSRLVCVFTKLFCRYHTIVLPGYARSPLASTSIARCSCGPFKTYAIRISCFPFPGVM